MTSQLCFRCKATIDSGDSLQSPRLDINTFNPAFSKKQASEMVLKEIANLHNMVQEFQRQINECQERILAWRAHQNKLCAISALPNDILLEIWAYLAEDAGQSIGSMVHWLNVTHVCSQWRKLALSTPTLWQWPCIWLPRLAYSLLERFGAIPIVLHIDFDQMESNGLTPLSFEFASRVLHRTRSLTLKITETTCLHARWALPLLTTSTNGDRTALKTITVDYQTLDSFARYGLDLVKFFQMTPEVKKISLQNATFFNSPTPLTMPLSNLTHLEIYFNHDFPEEPSGSHVRPHRVLSTLKMLPNLISIILIGVFRPLAQADEEWHVVHAQPIALSCLQTIYVGVGLPIACFFFNNITYPADCQVTVEFTPNSIGWESDIPDKDALHTLLMTITGRISGPIRTLVINLDENGAYFAASFGMNANTEKDPSHFHLELFWSMDSPEFLTYIPTSLRELEILSVSIKDSSMDMWKAFGLLPNLSKIVDVEIDEHPSLLKVLASFRSLEDSIFEPIDPPSTPQLYFPSLIEIEHDSSLSNQETLNRVFQVRGAWDYDAGQKSAVDGSNVTNSGTL